MNLIAWIAILTVLSLIIIKGVGFFRKGMKLKEESKAQATFFRGIGIFMISVAISQLIYLFDFISRKAFGGRIFGSEYNFATIINRDYYVVIFFVLLFSAAFLIYPLEHYMLEMKRNIFTIITSIAVPLPIIIRLSEYYLDVNLTSDSLFYLIFSILWGSVLAILVITIGILILLYVQLGRKAPKGSVIMKKSIAIIIGFGLWICAIFVTSSILKGLQNFEEDLYKFIYPFVIPIISLWL